MARRLLKTLAATTAAVLAIALLSSCGGGEQDTTGARSSDADAASTTAADSAADGGTADADGTTADGAAPAYVTPQLRPSVKTGPLHVTQQGRDQFRDIGNYGTLTSDYYKESTKLALEEAARVIHEYLVAHVKYDWATTCSLLDDHALYEVTKLGSHFEEVAGKDCPTSISYLLGKVPARKTYAISEVDAGVLRVRREGGHLFWRSGGTPSTINLSRDEDGSWKLASILVLELGTSPS